MDALGREAGRVIVLRGTASTSGRRRPGWISGVARLSPENEAVSRLPPRPSAVSTPRRADLALIPGGCFGGGTGIAAACDVVVASEDAIFSISETRWGLMAGIILPQLCRRWGCARCALCADRRALQRAEARRLGLVHESARPAVLRWRREDREQC